jgi:hypothetical protein
MELQLVATIGGLFLIAAGAVLVALQVIVQKQREAEARTPPYVGQVHVTTRYVGLAVALLGFVLLLAAIGSSLAR